jgi:hypothetical protein
VLTATPRGQLKLAAFCASRMEAHSGCKLVVLTGQPKGIGG